MTRLVVMIKYELSMMYRNETYTIGRRPLKIFVVCGRSDVTPTMLLEAQLFTWQENGYSNREGELKSHVEGFYGTSSKNPVEQWSKVLWNGTRAHKTFSRVESPFYCMSTVALLVAIVRVTSLPHATKTFKFSFQWRKFNLCMQFSFC
jgi:hypothetical protein